MIKSNGTVFGWLEATVAVFVSGVAIAELIVYSPPVQDSKHRLSVTTHMLQLSPSSTEVDVVVTHGSGDENVRITAFPLSQPYQRRSIFVYYDAGYPTASVNPPAAQGMFDNLAGDLLVHHYSQAVTVIDTPRLVQLLRATDIASSRAVVMMSGVLPADAFSRRADLLTAWTKAGGLVVWGGATIGYYSGLNGKPLADSIPLSYGEAGPDIVLGKGLVTFPWIQERKGTVQTDLGSAFHITYTFASAGIKGGVALARAGRLLGWTASQYSSITYIPSGLGGYLVLGGEVLDAQQVAQDVSQILLSGAVNAAGPVAVKDFHLPDVAANTTFHWSLPFAVPKAGIMFVAFDPNPDSDFYVAHVIGQ